MVDQILNWGHQLDKVEKGFVIYFFILFLIWLLKIEWPKIEDTNRKASKIYPHYKLRVNKKRFVIEVVKWALMNLEYKGVVLKKWNVDVEISYYNHKKVHGLFYSGINKIKIFVNNHKKIEDLVDSCIHEVVHYLQFCHDPKNYSKNYKLLLDKLSYQKHPMELEARSIAASYTKSCMKYLIEKGFLTK
jgi:hypothetical protein